jgi:hypothetical protein
LPEKQDKDYYFNVWIRLAVELVALTIRRGANRRRTTIPPLESTDAVDECAEEGL